MNFLFGSILIVFISLIQMSEGKKSCTCPESFKNPSGGGKHDCSVYKSILKDIEGSDERKPQTMCPSKDNSNVWEKIKGLGHKKSGKPSPTEGPKRDTGSLDIKQTTIWYGLHSPLDCPLNQVRMMLSGKRPKHMPEEEKLLKRPNAQPRPMEKKEEKKGKESNLQCLYYDFQAKSEKISIPNSPQSVSQKLSEFIRGITNYGSNRDHIE